MGMGVVGRACAGRCAEAGLDGVNVILGIRCPGGRQGGRRGEGDCLHPGGRGARGHYSLAGRRSVVRRRDRQVVRWLQSMAMRLHRHVEPSSCRPGHEGRMEAHRRRVEHHACRRVGGRLWWGSGQ